MLDRRRHLLSLAAATLLLGMTAWAQEEAPEDDAADSDESVDEIVVVGSKPGDRSEVDSIYQDQLRERILRELEQMRREEEEYAWRTEDTTRVSQPSRISWGYDPRESYRMRNEVDVNALPMDVVQPATIFRIGF